VAFAAVRDRETQRESERRDRRLVCQEWSGGQDVSIRATWLQVC